VNSYQSTLHLPARVENDTVQGKNPKVVPKKTGGNIGKKGQREGISKKERRGFMCSWGRGEPARKSLNTGRTVNKLECRLLKKRDHARSRRRSEVKGE